MAIETAFSAKPAVQCILAIRYPLRETLHKTTDNHRGHLGSVGSEDGIVDPDTRFSTRILRKSH